MPKIIITVSDADSKTAYDAIFRLLYEHKILGDMRLEPDRKYRATIVDRASGKVLYRSRKYAVHADAYDAACRMMRAGGMKDAEFGIVMKEG